MFLFLILQSLGNVRLGRPVVRKRTLVVLKSPFHYKTPKHHISYSYYSTALCLSTRTDAYPKLREILSSYFVQSKIRRVQIKNLRSLNPNSLLLHW